MTNNLSSIVTKYVLALLLFYLLTCFLFYDVLDSATGLIQKHPNVTLDREETPEFQLIIQVTDGGAIPLASNASVFIDVQVKNYISCIHLSIHPSTLYIYTST